MENESSGRRCWLEKPKWRNENWRSSFLPGTSVILVCFSDEPESGSEKCDDLVSRGAGLSDSAILFFLCFLGVLVGRGKWKWDTWNPSVVWEYPKIDGFLFGAFAKTNWVVAKKYVNKYRFEFEKDYFEFMIFSDTTAEGMPEKNFYFQRIFDSLNKFKLTKPTNAFKFIGSIVFPAWLKIQAMQVPKLSFQGSDGRSCQLNECS